LGLVLFELDEYVVGGDDPLTNAVSVIGFVLLLVVIFICITSQGKFVLNFFVLYCWNFVWNWFL